MCMNIDFMRSTSKYTNIRRMTSDVKSFKAIVVVRLSFLKVKNRPFFVFIFLRWSFDGFYCNTLQKSARKEIININPMKSRNVHLALLHQTIERLFLWNDFVFLFYLLGIIGNSILKKNLSNLKSVGMIFRLPFEIRFHRTMNFQLTLKSTLWQGYFLFWS